MSDRPISKGDKVKVRPDRVRKETALFRDEIKYLSESTSEVKKIEWCFGIRYACVFIPGSQRGWFVNTDALERVDA